MERRKTGRFSYGLKRYGSGVVGEVIFRAFVVDYLNHTRYNS